MAKKWRIGLVGVRRGFGFARLFAAEPRCEVVACCDLSPEVLARVQRELNLSDSQCFTDYDKFIRSGLPTNSQHVSPADLVFRVGACLALHYAAGHGDAELLLERGRCLRLQYDIRLVTAERHKLENGIELLAQSR